MFTQGYIGVSINSKKRFHQHHKQCENPHLQKAINKYGWDNLIKTDILVADKTYCLDIETKLRSKNNIGWNISSGGGNPPSSLGNRYTRVSPVWNVGLKSSEETVKKISDAVKLAMSDPARRQQNRQHMLGNTNRRGVKHSAETLAKIVARRAGQPSSKKGKLLTVDQKKRMSDLMKLHPWDCPHCHKIGFGVGAKNRWHFDNCKMKKG